MATWSRRSVLATGASLSTLGALASIGSTAEESTDSEGTPSSSGRLDGPEGWSSARGNAANSRYLPLEGTFAEPDTIAWRHDERGDVAVVDGAVYIWTDGELHALDADDGSVEWQTEIDASGAPAVSDGTLFVTGENHLTALDTADGSLAWEREFEIDESIPDPTVAFDTVYLVVDEILYAFDVDDGSVRWEKETINARPIRSEGGDPEPASFRPETVAVANGTVYAALDGPTYDEQDSGRAFGAVDATTGDERWGIGFYPDDEDNVITEPIVATGQYVYADDNISLNGVRFDVETGDATGNEYAVWAGTDSVRIDTGYDMNRHLTATNTETGESWTDSTAIGAWQAPLIVGETVISRHNPETPEEQDYPHNSLVALDLTDGSERWVLEFDDYFPDITAYDRPAVTAVDEYTLYIDTGEELVAMRRSDDADERDGEPKDEDEKSDQNDDQQGDEDVDAGDDEDESGCPDDDPTDE